MPTDDIRRRLAQPEENASRPWEWTRGRLEALAFVGVLVLVFVLIWVLPRLIGGVVD